MRYQNKSELDKFTDYLLYSLGNLSPTCNKIMKTRFSSACYAIFFVFAGMESARATLFISKADNSIPLNQGGSWVGGNAPSDGQFIFGAYWDSTVSANNTASAQLGGFIAWAGIAIYNPGGDVAIPASSYTLTLRDNGINMLSASKDLTLSCRLNLASSQFGPYSQSWNVAAGRKLTIGADVYAGGAVITLGGEGIVQIGNGLTSGEFLQPASIVMAGGTLAFNRSGNVFQQAIVSGNVNTSLIINNSTTAGNANTITFADGMNLFGTVKNSSAGKLVIAGSENSTNTLLRFA